MVSESFDWPSGSQAAITLSFDDGFEPTCQASSQLMLERDLPGTYHIIAEMTGGYLDGLPLADWTALRELHNSGHEIASHGLRHQPLAGVTSDVKRLTLATLQAPNRLRYLRQLWTRKKALGAFKDGRSERGYAEVCSPFEEVRTSRQLIEARLENCRVESFSYPKGRHSPAVRQAVAQAGYRSARTIDPGINIPSGDVFALRGVALGPGMGEEELSAWIDHVVKMRGWLVLVFHLVAGSNPGDYPYFYSLKEYESLIERLVSLPVWVASQREVIAYWEKHGLKELVPK